MPQLTREDLWSLEEYAQRRIAFRTEVMAHKRTRQLALGENARLYFEDEMTIRYQVQEMLRIEKTFEAEGIEEELSAYNPLIPDGSNWKATFMVEFGDPEERAKHLAQMIGIGKRNLAASRYGARIIPIADEDLERATEEKTSSVHFLRFELTPQQVNAMREGADLSAGIEHTAYPIEKFTVNAVIRDSLANDLAPTQH